METVLYELHFRAGDLLLLLIPLLVGAGIWGVSCRITRQGRADKRTFAPGRDLSHSPALKWILRGVAIFSGLLFVLTGASHLTDYKELKNRYDGGDYLTVEGYVRDLTTARYSDKGGDSFTINGVTFAYTDADLTLHGYRTEARRGGVVTREGQYLVIRYLPDPDTETNHILYIAEKEAPPS